MRYSMEQVSPISLRVVHALGLISTFVLAATAVFALMMNVVFFESFHSARLAPVLVTLILFHLMRYQKIHFGREFVLYILFFCYMLVELLWTADVRLAMNTLVPALNFIVILILFGALVKYHDIRAVLAGMFGGFLAGAAVYTAFTRFPFGYPADFSYNAVALMYLFGLFVALLFACYKSSKGLFLIVGLVILAHIVATTSIKTNLGILLGASVAGLTYFRHFKRLVRRNIVPLILLFGVLGYLVASNDSLMVSLDRGVSRVALGIKVLQVRDDVPGYSAAGSRGEWQKDGLAGWIQNPVFGHGVESFRSRFGTTSHSTPIDLLHNSGLIGVVLFYSIFASIAWRLLLEAEASQGNLRLLIFSTLICFLFITLSGTMHYSSFLAAFVAISVAILSQDGCRTAMPTDHLRRIGR